MNEATVQEIWKKGKLIPGRDENEWRRDVFGLAMRRDLYGKRRGHGWLIAPKHPKARTSSARAGNLLPFRWEVIADAE